MNMIGRKAYLMACLAAIRKARYWPRIGGPFFLLLLSYVPIKQSPIFQDIMFWASILWLVWELFWFPYHLINEELEKRDAELLQTTPRAREDRAFRLLTALLHDGKKTLTGWTPQQIEMWDKDVRLTLAQWCQPGALEVYMLNTRPYNEDRLTEPQKALDQLETMLNAHLFSVYIK